MISKGKAISLARNLIKKEIGWLPPVLHVLKMNLGAKMVWIVAFERKSIEGDFDLKLGPYMVHVDLESGESSFIEHL